MASDIVISKISKFRVPRSFVNYITKLFNEEYKKRNSTTNTSWIVVSDKQKGRI